MIRVEFDHNGYNVKVKAKAMNKFNPVGFELMVYDTNGCPVVLDETDTDELNEIAIERLIDKFYYPDLYETFTE